MARKNLISSASLPQLGSQYWGAELNNYLISLDKRIQEFNDKLSNFEIANTYDGSGFMSGYDLSIVNRTSNDGLINNNSNVADIGMFVTTSTNGVDEPFVIPRSYATPTAFLLKGSVFFSIPDTSDSASVSFAFDSIKDDSDLGFKISTDNWLIETNGATENADSVLNAYENYPTSEEKTLYERFRGYGDYKGFEDGFYGVYLAYLKNIKDELKENANDYNLWIVFDMTGKGYKNNPLYIQIGEVMLSSAIEGVVFRRKTYSASKSFYETYRDSLNSQISIKLPLVKTVEENNEIKTIFSYSSAIDGRGVDYTLYGNGLNPTISLNVSSTKSFDIMEFNSINDDILKIEYSDQDKSVLKFSKNEDIQEFTLITKNDNGISYGDNEKMDKSYAYAFYISNTGHLLYEKRMLGESNPAANDIAVKGLQFPFLNDIRVQCGDIHFFGLLYYGVEVENDGNSKNRWKYREPSNSGYSPTEVAVRSSGDIDLEYLNTKKYIVPNGNKLGLFGYEYSNSGNVDNLDVIGKIDLKNVATDGSNQKFQFVIADKNDFSLLENSKYRYQFGKLSFGSLSSDNYSYLKFNNVEFKIRDTQNSSFTVDSHCNYVLKEGSLEVNCLNTKIPNYEDTSNHRIFEWIINGGGGLYANTTLKINSGYHSTSMKQKSFINLHTKTSDWEGDIIKFNYYPTNKEKLNLEMINGLDTVINGATTLTISGSYILSTNNNTIILRGSDLQVPATVTWSSDKRIKKNIETLDEDLCYKIVEELDSKSFTFKDSNIDSLGFIAQEVEALTDKYAPILVKTSKQEDIEDFKSIQENKMVFILWQAVKKLMKQVKGE